MTAPDPIKGLADAMRSAGSLMSDPSRGAVEKLKMLGPEFTQAAALLDQLASRGEHERIEALELQAATLAGQVSLLEGFAARGSTGWSVKPPASRGEPRASDVGERLCPECGHEADLHQGLVFRGGDYDWACAHVDCTCTLTRSEVEARLAGEGAARAEAGSVVDDVAAETLREWLADERASAEAGEDDADRLAVFWRKEHDRERDRADAAEKEAARLQQDLDDFERAARRDIEDRDTGERMDLLRKRAERAEANAEALSREAELRVDAVIDAMDKRVRDAQAALRRVAVDRDDAVLELNELRRLKTNVFRPFGGMTVFPIEDEIRALQREAAEASRLRAENGDLHAELDRAYARCNDALSKYDAALNEKAGLRAELEGARATHGELIAALTRMEDGLDKGWPTTKDVHRSLTGLLRKHAPAAPPPVREGREAGGTHQESLQVGEGERIRIFRRGYDKRCREEEAGIPREHDGDPIPPDMRGEAWAAMLSVVRRAADMPMDCIEHSEIRSDANGALALARAAETEGGDSDGE